MPTSTVCSPAPEDRPNSTDSHGIGAKILGLLSRAGRDPGLTPPNKAVLLAVVAHADEDGVCQATDHALARDSHTSVPTVQRALLLFQGERVLERVYCPPASRVIRLITGEQSSVVVDDLDFSNQKKQHQHTKTKRHYSLASSPNSGESPKPVHPVGEETDRLVALLADWKVTEQVARKLVTDFPDRIAAQVEAHMRRKVWNKAGSLVMAIREDWPIVTPQSPPSAKEQQEEARKQREAEKRAILDGQAALNARKRAEDEKVRLFWDALGESERQAFDEEAVEASPYRDEIRNTKPDAPLHRIQRTTARWEHIREKLGLSPKSHE